MQFDTRTLPLFPLDVVLFPGMMMPLHIFEPRYRKLVVDCMASGSPFGMVWAEQEPLELDATRPLVGTTAMLTEIDPLPDGRFNVQALGGERFLLRSVSVEEPYLVGHIEPFPLLHRDSAAAKRRVQPLQQLFTQYLKLLGKLAEQNVALNPMPDDAATLAFAVAILYQGQNWRKQELLSIQSLPELMQREIEWLRLENVLARQALQLRMEDRVPPLIEGSLAMYSLN